VNPTSLSRKAEAFGRQKKFGTDSKFSRSLLSEQEFRRMLCQERKRSERSRKDLLMMLVEDTRDAHQKKNGSFLKDVATSLCVAIRETDLVGWFETNSILGFVFTEFGDSEVNVAADAIKTKVLAELGKALKENQLRTCQISIYAFPERDGGYEQGRPIAEALYPDLLEVEKKKKAFLVTKRVMDLVGSSLALLLLSPVFLILAIAIKMTSKGPVFFRQRRLGQYGAPFTLWKFRSMHSSTDADLHKQYVQDFITAKASLQSDPGEQKPVYKITNDPRVTPIGRLLRRASLDELPQFWNVLRGEMSLVGPRPPIPYEIQSYDIWHRRRLLEAKPGVTGLWQVRGRSRTTFNEMVRLDLQYSRTRSVLLDLKILVKTPGAVFSGDGAY
jgi:lipopolysaccharide/colanic/teichoic acid biosynthesis glycosyltransferase